jgi:cell division protein FtsW (lipid II flippase)
LPALSPSALRLQPQPGTAIVITTIVITTIVITTIVITTIVITTIVITTIVITTIVITTIVITTIIITTTATIIATRGIGVTHASLAHKHSDYRRYRRNLLLRDR